ncbi:MAG: hypothetical protein AMXMBFR7_16260 [Planctomycetota bacterium]
MAGSCSSNGNELQFNATLIQRIPNEAARALVAHELAHAFLEGMRHQKNFVLAKHEEEEFVVDQVMKARWGFDDTLITQWVETHPEIHDLLHEANSA